MLFSILLSQLNLVIYAASKEYLIPAISVLTRFKKKVGIKAFVKKELIVRKLPDVRISTDINVLPTPTLCVQLNTLYVISGLSS